MLTTRSGTLALVLCLFWYAPVHAQVEKFKTRGELLYANHCNECHTSKMYWRENRLVTDLDSLKFQVRRWQASIKLGWSKDEIADVVRYLNATYYGFSDVGQESLMKGGKPLQALHN